MKAEVARIILGLWSTHHDPYTNDLLMGRYRKRKGCGDHV